jgi:hypothetical protein
MRTLTDHTVSGDQAVQLHIEVQDEPGQGGACHKYAIFGWHSQGNSSADSTCNDETKALILFQNGPIKEFGVNGITGEALIAIEIDRLRGFQKGPFACRENAIALTHLEEALMWLQRRTVERIKRGVEGTNQK